MDLLRQQIFSSAALAQNQHGRIRRRHSVSHFECAPHLRRASDHLAELSFRRQAPLEHIIFFFQAGQLQQICHSLS